MALSRFRICTSDNFKYFVISSFACSNGTHGCTTASSTLSLHSQDGSQARAHSRTSRTCTSYMREIQIYLTHRHQRPELAIQPSRIDVFTRYISLQAMYTHSAIQKAVIGVPMSLLTPHLMLRWKQNWLVSSVERVALQPCCSQPNVDNYGMRWWMPRSQYPTKKRACVALSQKNMDESPLRALTNQGFACALVAAQVKTFVVKV